jgi:hypothetical protein
MEGEECNITFHEEGTERTLGYLKAPFPPDVGDTVYICETLYDVNSSWEVTRRKFIWPPPGSMTHQKGGRYPIMDIFVKEAPPFFK